jgi:hypothetical protein
MFGDCKGQLVVAAEASRLYFLSGVHIDETTDPYSQVGCCLGLVCYIKEQSERVEWKDASS